MWRKKCRTHRQGKGVGHQGQREAFVHPKSTHAPTQRPAIRRLAHHGLCLHSLHKVNGNVVHVVPYACCKGLWRSTQALQDHCLCILITRQQRGPPWQRPRSLLWLSASCFCAASCIAVVNACASPSCTGGCNMKLSVAWNVPACIIRACCCCPCHAVPNGATCPSAEREAEGVQLVPVAGKQLILEQQVCTPSKGCCCASQRRCRHHDGLHGAHPFLHGCLFCLKFLWHWLIFGESAGKQQLQQPFQRSNHLIQILACEWGLAVLRGAPRAQRRTWCSPCSVTAIAAICARNFSSSSTFLLDASRTLTFNALQRWVPFACNAKTRRVSLFPAPGSATSINPSLSICYECAACTVAKGDMVDLLTLRSAESYPVHITTKSVYGLRCLLLPGT